MQTLQQYLDEQGETATAFAKRIGRDVSTVTRAAQGRIPDPSTMKLIYEATDHKVEPNDFHGINGAG